MPPVFPWTDEELLEMVRNAVREYWVARTAQATKQISEGQAEGGRRGEVTGGQHLNAFCDLLCKLISQAGFLSSEVRFKSGVEIPGYYRPTKKWDIVVFRRDRLCAAIEMKSQVGPSFGNNTNNRTEEAVGSSVDLWRAFKEGVMGAHPPWVGYFFFLEDAPKSRTPVRLAESVFPPDPIFQNTSYADRYRILCQRMVFERNYNSACLLLSPRGNYGDFSEPAVDLGFAQFAKSLFGHLIGCE
jgi:Restriction endonuclease XhoI.